MHTASVSQVLGQALGLLVSGLPSCMTGAYVSPSFEDPWNQTGSAPGALGFLRNCSTPDIFSFKKGGWYSIKIPLAY